MTVEEDAEKEFNIYNNNFVQIIDSIKLKINTYENLYNNFNNVNELYLNYKKDNDSLDNSFKNTRNDILTNERKTFYQNQQVDTLKFYYYYFIFTVYCICVFCFAIFSFIYPSKTSWIIRLAIFIGLIILPFVSTWFLGLLIYILYTIYNLFPKNVYKDELDTQTKFNQFKNIL